MKRAESSGNILKSKAAKWLMTKGINFWGPFLGAGIRVKEASLDMTSITVELRATLLNKNIVGVHFGGSIYAMCDPFYMGILMHHLGHDYTVWDKGATIRFLKPGRGTLSATFAISTDAIKAIKQRADRVGKTEENFTACVTDRDGNIIAEVDKLLWIRNKNMKRPNSP
ncbi:MAG: DUF4442 domain-containing protein [Proteobacteria bacterium]|nr:DUF4442 domain-containing protein [Pseudomonadota bacterium]